MKEGIQISWLISCYVYVMVQDFILVELDFFYFTFLLLFFDLIYSEIYGLTKVEIYGVGLDLVGVKL